MKSGRDCPRAGESLRWAPRVSCRGRGLSYWGGHRGGAVPPRGRMWWARCGSLAAAGHGVVARARRCIPVSRIWWARCGSLARRGDRAEAGGEGSTRSSDRCNSDRSAAFSREVRCGAVEPHRVVRAGRSSAVSDQRRGQPGGEGSTRPSAITSTAIEARPSRVKSGAVQSSRTGRARREIASRRGDRARRPVVKARQDRQGEVRCRAVEPHRPSTQRNASRPRRSRAQAGGEGSTK